MKKVIFIIICLLVYFSSFAVDLPRVKSSELDEIPREKLLSLCALMFKATDWLLQKEYDADFEKIAKLDSERLIDKIVKKSYKTQIKSAPYVFKFDLRDGYCGSCARKGYIVCDAKLNTLSVFAMSARDTKDISDEVIYSNKEKFFVSFIVYFLGAGSSKSGDIYVHEYKKNDTLNKILNMNFKFDSHDFIDTKGIRRFGNIKILKQMFNKPPIIENISVKIREKYDAEGRTYTLINKTKIRETWKYNGSKYVLFRTESLPIDITKEELTPYKLP